jgi:hypothetical protein
MHVASDSKHVWSWFSVDSSYKVTKIPFTGINGPSDVVNSVLESFLPFDEEVIDIIVTEMSYAACYIRGCNLKPKLRMHNWMYVTREKLNIVFWTLEVDGYSAETYHQIVFQ